ncbi:SDR family NAD(P)-dependent oxidoreductase [Arthrobacter sp. NPDC058127]|uniref:SDR family NAD(P)-dependent oxidoreductase n=1 Tax=Arthrobacter sp. NPDC058127 TaxID=3346351 RepID=UPI0036EB7A6F
MTYAVPEVSDRTLKELLSLKGRRAVVTGGGRGLGKAIATRLAEAGADLLIGDLDEESARQAATELRDRYAVATCGMRMDVTDTTSVAGVVQVAAARLGGIDIWVNNAGIFPSVPLLEMTDSLWDEVFAVNSRGVFVGAREAARHMTAAGNGGVIINVISTAGFRGTAPGLSAYVSSKHAARGMTRQLALELAPYGIRVLGVAPTYIPTEGNQIAASSQPMPTDALPAMMLTSRLGRIGVPDDIARVALFCASDLSAFMTGSTLLADAGETL